MKKLLFFISLFSTAVVLSQNLLTQNPSFESYSNNEPTGWEIADASSVMEIVMDASDGSVGLKVKKDPNYTQYINFRIKTTQYIYLEEQPLSLKFDYKVLSGDIAGIGLSMRPDTWEFATNTDIVSDNQWHYDNYANMQTDYIGHNWAYDYLNVQIYHAQGEPNSEVIIDNLAFGYVGTLGVEEFTDVFPQEYSLGPNPTDSSITFFNVEKISDTSVQIFDLQGAMVLQTELVGDTLDLSLLPKGVYFLQLGNTLRKKIVKK